MYLLINKHHQCLGVFSTKEIMKLVVEVLIQNEYEDTGNIGGNYHFRYIEFEPDDLWLKAGNPACKAFFSLNTMHPEYFEHEIETDWSTGKITKI